jgi:valyl-tRNA synthetase
MEKISKSRGGGSMAPLEMIRTYSADAIRYWAAGVSTGKDAVISPEKIAMGAKLATKLWNVARFSERFLAGYELPATLPELSAADRWILARLQRLVRRVTEAFDGYDYATAKNEAEDFFWRDLADNYLEMGKGRLYDEGHPLRDGACFALYTALLTLLKLFAPLFPYVTEAVYQGLFAPTGDQGYRSIHRSRWPEVDPRLEDPAAAQNGERLVEIATAVRRFKSEHNLPLGTELSRLQLSIPDAALAGWLGAAIPDLAGITRAREIKIVQSLDPMLTTILESNIVQAALGE